MKAIITFLQTIIKNLSIRKKLIFLSTLTSSIAVIITCGGFIIFTLYEEKNEIIDQIAFLAGIISHDVAEDLHTNNFEDIRKSMTSLKFRSKVLQACINDTNNKEIASYIKNKKFFNCDNLPKLNKKYNFSTIGNTNYLLYAKDIKYNEKKYGSIFIVSDLKSIREKIVRSIYNSSILLFFILIISYVLSKILHKNVYEPIIMLSDVSYSVKSGNYGVRVKYNSKDEIGSLIEVFNNMLNVIQEVNCNLENKILERTKDLKNALDIKSQFLSNMSHEIRTPIHGIMNYADFLVNDWNSLEENKKYSFIEKLHQNTDRLLSLINNLLDMSRLEAKKMNFFFEENNFIEIVKNVMQEVEPLYINKNININLIYDKESSFIAFLDRERIMQVVRNLLSNAIKFTDEGNIDIKIENSTDTKKHETRETILCCIEDEGKGIPSEDLELIFNKFNQSNNNKSASGSGLGLTISREIINSHDGKIWAKNNNNKKGSSFLFFIPISQYIQNENVHSTEKFDIL